MCVVLLLLFVCCCFCYLFWVSFLLFSFLSFYSGHTVWLEGSWFPGRGLAWASGVRALSPGCWTTRGFPGPGNINQHVHSQRYPCQHQDPAAHNCLQAPVLDTSHQTTSKTGTQPHPSADRLSKVILSSQIPQNTPPDMALPFRRKRLNSTHQSTGTSPSHQEAYTSPWTSLIHQGADNRSKRNYDPADCRRETVNTVG